MAKSKYKKNFPARAGKYARDGLTDIEICKKLGVGKTAYHRYQKEHKNFRDSIERGKIPVNVRVEKALLKRALGYPVVERTTEYIKPKGKGRPVKVSMKKVEKGLAPDVTAQKFFLANRDPERWREKKELEVKIKEMSIKKMKKALADFDDD